MTWSLDARLPVRFGSAEDASAEAALLLEEGMLASAGRTVTHFGAGATGSHDMGCTCCTPRSRAAQALAQLFLARGRGHAPLFREVVVVAGPDGRGGDTGGADQRSVGFRLVPAGIAGP